MLSCFMYYYYEVFSCQLFPKGFLLKRILSEHEIKLDGFKRCLFKTEKYLKTK